MKIKKNPFFYDIQHDPKNSSIPSQDRDATILCDLTLLEVSPKGVTGCVTSGYVVNTKSVIKNGLELTATAQGLASQSGMCLSLLFIMICPQAVPVKNKDWPGCAGCSFLSTENTALPPNSPFKTRQVPDPAPLKTNLWRGARSIP